MKNYKLYMIMLGCKPKGRNTEQHDIFFGIAKDLKDLIPELQAFWPEAKDKLHIDAWREVCQVDGYQVEVVIKETEYTENQQLFFINLGGYKPNEFDEPHYKMLIAATNKANAIQQAKASAFYLHTGFKGAVSHIDDKYGVDVDDILEIDDILSEAYKSKFKLKITPTNALVEDEIHLGYLPLWKVK